MLMARVSSYSSKGAVTVPPEGAVMLDEEEAFRTSLNSAEMEGTTVGGTGVAHVLFVTAIMFVIGLVLGVGTYDLGYLCDDVIAYWAL
jgi:hypothetical protein